MNLATLPATADVVLELDEHHDCVRSRYATHRKRHDSRTTSP